MTLEQPLTLGNPQPPILNNSEDRGSIPHSSDEELHDNYIYLVGRPPLKRFLDFVLHETIEGRSVDSGLLTDEWRAANDYIRKLERDEAGSADNPSVTPLPESLLPLRTEFLKSPLVQHSFNTVPTDIRMVELDRLVVYQKHIDLDFSRQLIKRLGPQPGSEDIFAACLPREQEKPRFKGTRTHHDQFSFISNSNDIRFLGPLFLDPSQIVDCPPPGRLAGVVGLAIGFGTNFLNAIYAENRLVLNNGSHRAFALRELGITHAPCVVQYVSSREELKVVASSDFRRNPDLYLKHPRPSMLRDYFDPKLRKLVSVPRRLHQVSVKFEVDESEVPVF